MRLVRSNIASLEPYSTARDEYKGNLGILLDANENPFGGGLNRYPSTTLRDSLVAKLADIKGVLPGQLFLGNGSDECIDLCYRVFCRPVECIRKRVAELAALGIFKETVERKLP